ncbi:melanoma-associated antigen 8 isoform X1 [Tanacetum coccineum]
MVQNEPIHNADDGNVVAGGRRCSWYVAPVDDKEGDKLVLEVIRYVLLKSQQSSGCLIKRDELTQLAFNKLSTFFGYDVKELQRVRPSSTNQARAPQRFTFVSIGIVHLVEGKITEGIIAALKTLWHHLGRLGMSQDDERHTDFASTKQAVETLVQQRYL